MTVFAVSAPRFDFLDRLHQVLTMDPALVAIHDDIVVGQRGASLSIVDDLVAFHSKFYIPSSLLHELVSAVNEDGHKGSTQASPPPPRLPHA